MVRTKEKIHMNPFVYKSQKHVSWDLIGNDKMESDTSEQILNDWL